MSCLLLVNVRKFKRVTGAVKASISAELLGQPDDDALGATHEAEPIAVLVLRDLADEFCTVGAQAVDDVVDVVDREHDAAGAERICGGALPPASSRPRRVGLLQLDAPPSRPGSP